MKIYRLDQILTNKLEFDDWTEPKCKDEPKGFSGGGDRITKKVYYTENFQLYLEQEI